MRVRLQEFSNLDSFRCQPRRLFSQNEGGKKGYKDGVSADQKIGELLNWRVGERKKHAGPFYSDNHQESKPPLQHQTRNYHRQDAPPLSNCTPPGSLSDVLICRVHCDV